MLKYFRTAWLVRKLNARNTCMRMHNINDNVVQMKMKVCIVQFQFVLIRESGVSRSDLVESTAASYTLPILEACPINCNSYMSAKISDVSTTQASSILNNLISSMNAEVLDWLIPAYGTHVLILF